MDNVIIQEKINLYKNNLTKLQILNKKLKKLCKKINSKIIFWVLVPLIGLFIFYSLRQNRIINSKFMQKINECKIEISKIEFENIILRREIEALNHGT